MKKLKVIGLFGVLVLVLLTASGAYAQDAATPTAGTTSLVPNQFDAPYAPGPDLCTATPISTDVAASLIATPVAAVEPQITDHGIVALPAGAVADEESTAAVLDVVTQLWACNNARNKAAILGLFTDQAIQSSFSVTEGSSWDFADLRADVAAALTPGEPRSVDELASIDGIVSVVQETSGRIGVLILNTDPNVADGHPVLDYFAFEQVDGAYKVAEVILDPFDMTDGYGYDGA